MADKKILKLKQPDVIRPPAPPPPPPPPPAPPAPPVVQRAPLAPLRRDRFAFKADAGPVSGIGTGSASTGTPLPTAASIPAHRLQSAASVAPATNLLNEDTRDSQVNCLDAAADVISQQTPAQQQSSQLVLLQDQRPGAEGTTGHAVVETEDEIIDGTTGARYGSWDEFRADPANPQNAYYEEAGRIPATDALEIFETAPGSPERSAALERTGVPAQLQGLLVADNDAGGGGGGSSVPERRAELEAFADDIPNDPRADASGAEDASALAVALRGESDLGDVSEEEQEILINRALDRWTDSEELPQGAIAQLPEFYSGPVVAQVYAERAASIEAGLDEDSSDEERATAAALATHAVQAARTPEGRQQLMDALGPEASSQLVTALGVDAQRANSGALNGSQNSLLGISENARAAALTNLLEAAAGAPQSESARGVVTTALAVTTSSVIANNDEAGQALASALVAHGPPMDPAQQEAEQERLAGILGTEQGRELLLGSNIPAQARLQNLALVRGNPEWDEALFTQTEHIFDNAEVAQAIAAPRFAQFAGRGDAPQVLSGTDLENTIGTAFGYPAQIPEDETPEEAEQREAALANGDYSYFQGEPAEEQVQLVADAIREVGGPDPSVTVLPVQFGSAETGVVDLPLFRVTDSSGAERYVDNEGRTYDSFEDWKTENNLPPGNMVYPRDGHLTAEGTSESSATPDTVDTVGEHVVAALDDAALVGGLIAGGAAILGTGGLAVPLVGGAATAWATYRGADVLIDRAEHGQSLSLSDPAARAAWLNTAAGALSFVASGAQAVSRFIPAVASATRGLGAAAFGADTLAAGNAGFELISSWDQLDANGRANLALQLGFWGAGATAAFRQARGLTQTRPFDSEANRTAAYEPYLETPPRDASVSELVSRTHDPATAAEVEDFLARQGLTLDSPVYRWTDPQYLGADGQMAGNPSSMASVTDIYNAPPPSQAFIDQLVASGFSQAEATQLATTATRSPIFTPSVNATTLGPTLNVTTSPTSSYAVPGQVQVQMTIRDFLNAGGLIYPDTGAVGQGAYILSLPPGSTVPYQVVGP